MAAVEPLLPVGGQPTPEDVDVELARPVGDLPKPLPSWARFLGKTWLFFLTLTVIGLIRISFIDHQLGKFFMVFQQALLAPMMIMVPWFWLPSLLEKNGALLEKIFPFLIAEGFAIAVLIMALEPLRQDGETTPALVFREMLTACKFLLGYPEEGSSKPCNGPCWRQWLVVVWFWVIVVAQLFVRLLLSWCYPRVGVNRARLAGIVTSFFIIPVFLTEHPCVYMYIYYYEMVRVLPQGVQYLRGKGDAPHLYTLAAALVMLVLFIFKVYKILWAQAMAKIQKQRTAADIRHRIEVIQEGRWFEAEVELGNTVVQSYEAFDWIYACSNRHKAETKRTKIKRLVDERYDGLRPACLQMHKISRAEIIKTSLDILKGVSTIAILADKLDVGFEGEPAIDAGGVQRDWLDALGKQLVAEAATPTGHLALGPDGTICPRPGESRLPDLFAIGRVLGLAIRHKIPVPIPLNSVACKRALNEPMNVRDVERVDEMFYKNRVAMLLEPNGVSTMEEALGMSLYFTSAPTDLRPEERELCPGGQDKVVTEENKYEYISLLCKDFLAGGMEKQIAAVMAGLWDVIPQSVLKAAGVNFRELTLLIGGFSDVDPKQWRRFSICVGSTTVLDNFWSAVEDLSPEDRAKLLHFATGSSQLPVEGFQRLNPRFKVEVTDDWDTERLPQAHTCFNSLVIPPYRSKIVLQTKLQSALANDVGFGFA